MSIAAFLGTLMRPTYILYFASLFLFKPRSVALWIWTGIASILNLLMIVESRPYSNITVYEALAPAIWTGVYLVFHMVRRRSATSESPSLSLDSEVPLEPRSTAGAPWIKLFQFGGDGALKYDNEVRNCFKNMGIYRSSLTPDEEFRRTAELRARNFNPFEAAIMIAAELPERDRPQSAIRVAINSDLLGYRLDQSRIEVSAAIKQLTGSRISDQDPN